MPDRAADEYLMRLAARRASHAACDAVDARFAYGRLAAVALTVVLGILAWRSTVSAWWLVVPVVIFAWLVRQHDRLLRRRDGVTRAIATYERGLARLDDRWAGAGEPGDRFRDDRHVYANDLDLFGRGSLFELLSLARIRTGEDMLAGWLTTPASVSEIRARQDAVAELGPALDLRERLALAGTDLRKAVQTDRLLDWAEQSMLPAR